jgi:hypothetical protein
VRTAVDLEDHRVLDVRVESGRLENPALDRFPIGRVDPERLRLGDHDLRQELRVDVG